MPALMCMFNIVQTQKVLTLSEVRERTAMYTASGMGN